MLTKHYLMLLSWDIYTGIISTCICSYTFFVISLCFTVKHIKTVSNNTFLQIAKKLVLLVKFQINVSNP